MDKLKTNYVSRVRFRKGILFVEIVGLGLYIAGFATPYWVTFLSESSNLDSCRGLFATCVRTAGKLNCADIEDFPVLLLVSNVCACFAVITYIAAVVTTLLVINYTSEQRRRLVMASFITSIGSACFITATLVTYTLYANTFKGTPWVIFYLVITSDVLILISGILWILDFNLPEPKKPKRKIRIPPLAMLEHDVQTPISKIPRKSKTLPETKPDRLFTKVLYTRPSKTNNFKLIKKW